MSTPGIIAPGFVRQLHTPDQLSAGHIRYETITIASVDPDTTGLLTMSWPYDIGISSGQMFGVTDDNDDSVAGKVGDWVKVWADIQHPSFQLTADASASATIINAPAALVQALKLSVGDFIALGIDEETAEEAHVINVDRDTGAITIENGIGSSYVAGTVLHMHRYFVGRPDAVYHIIPGKIYRWGEDTFDSALLPANTPLRLQFHNSESSGSARTARGELSILYGDA